MTKLNTFSKTLLAAALVGTALTAVAQDAFARGGGGGFRGGGGGGFHGGGGGFHFGGGGGGFHFGGGGGGRRSFGGMRSGGGHRFAAPRSFGGARFRSGGSFARPHFAAVHRGVARPFGGMRTSTGGHFGRPAVGPHFGGGAKPIGPLAMGHGGLKPGHHPGFPGGKGRGPHVRLPGRILALGVGLAGVGLAGGDDDGPGYDNPGYDGPVYAPPVPVYRPVAGGPTIPNAPLVPAAAQTPPPVAPVAAPQQVAGSFINVVFQPAVGKPDIETFLKAYNVSIVDGPAPDGTFRIQLSTEPMAEADLAAVVDSMKSQTVFVKDIRPA